MCGFPHFKNVEFNGQFPMASLDFKDDKFPANVNMTAFNPFIPLGAKNSSIPSAFFEIEIENTTSKNVKYQIASSFANPYENSINKADTMNGFKILTLFNNGDRPNKQK